MEPTHKQHKILELVNLEGRLGKHNTDSDIEKY
jgi:hypothetical protein